jgi:biopolymer transport protein ExbB
VEQLFKTLALNGGSWILYALVFLSALSIAVMIERAIYFILNKEDVASLMDGVTEKLENQIPNEAVDLVKDQKSPVKRVLFHGLSALDHGICAVEAMLSSQSMTERIRMERYLAVLGTIGNNAPFIGLLGTVLGVIKAFNDLAVLSSRGPSAVMAGISEALIATAVGLFVAIPAVIAYNYFQRKVKTDYFNLESASKILMSFLLRANNPVIEKEGKNANR